MKVGDLVRLQGRKRRARIVALITEVKGGVVLDRALGGFRCWNVLDLEVIEHGRQEIRSLVPRGQEETS